MQSVSLSLSGLLAGARAALSATFRERAHLPSSPWFAFIGTYGGVIIDRTDNPERLIPTEWRQVCRVNNARSDDANLETIRQALSVAPLRAWEAELATLHARDLASARSGGCDCDDPIADPAWEGWDGSCKRCGGAVDLSGGAA